MKVTFITTGGTIDKVYFDKRSDFQVGDSLIEEILAEANIAIEYDIIRVFRKDSLYLTDRDRKLIRSTIATTHCRRFVVTHGTDTMIETARLLKGLPKKVVVLTGSMQPAGFKSTDAMFNIGSAVTAVLLLPPGVYIVINGRVFDPEKCRKNRKKNRFEEIEAIDGTQP